MNLQPSSGEPPDTLSSFVHSLDSMNPSVMIDDLCADPVDSKMLAGYIAAICAALCDAGVNSGATIAVRVGFDAQSVVGLLAAAAYGVAVPVAADAPNLPAGPFDIGALVTTIPSAGDEPRAATPVGDELRAATPVGDELRAATPVGDELRAATPVGDELRAATPVGDELRAATPVGDEPRAAMSAGDEVPVTIDVSDLSAIKPGDVTAVPVRAPTEPALLLCTSGTTGDPKWVRISHRNLVAAGTFIAAALRLSPADRGLSIMPLHHGHGITAGVLAPLFSGGGLVIVDSSDLAFLEEGLQCGITWYSAAPTVHSSMLVAKRAWPEWFEAFRPRVIRSTSEALPAADRALLESEFSAVVIEAYALTEVPGHVCSQALGTATEACWMPPQPGVEVETVDADGRPTEPGVPGRIRVRGPNVMLGYLNHEPIAPDGWYMTSDIGVRRPDGAVSVLGRDSDAIKRGGETIAPAMVESLVEKHPDIDRARVCGIPHESLGEQICVAVITGRGESAADELLRELRLMLPTNLTPSKLRIVDSFHGSTEGKIRRSDLRLLFAE